MPIGNLGKRSLLRIHGADAMRYLNGQITQDVRLLEQSPDTALPTCVTDAKGRMQAYGSIFLMDDAVCIEAPWELRESLMARIERYLIADDAEIEDMSDAYVLLHEVAPYDQNIAPYLTKKFSRLGVAGQDHWFEVGADMPAADLTTEELEQIRLKHGIPMWGKELTEGVFPAEAGLTTNAVSFYKGCYVGQEVVSRMKTAGKINRCLFLLELDTFGIEAGMELLVDDMPVGVITSVVGQSAMAWVKKTAFAMDEFRLGNGVRARRVGVEETKD